MSTRKSDEQTQIAAAAQKLIEDTGVSADLQTAVKQVLHSEILNACETVGLLDSVVGQGGTFLNQCHGGQRFSEDLDFAGLEDGHAEELHAVAELVKESIRKKYGIEARVGVKVAQQSTDSIAVSRIRVKVPISKNPSIPNVLVKTEFATVTAYTDELRMLRNPFTEKGSVHTTFMHVEKPEELVADKLVSATSAIQGDRGYLRARDALDVWTLYKNFNLDFDYIGTLVGYKEEDYGLETGSVAAGVTKYLSELRSDNYIAIKTQSGYVWNESLAKQIRENEGAEQIFTTFAIAAARSLDLDFEKLIEDSIERKPATLDSVTQDATVTFRQQTVELDIAQQTTIVTNDIGNL